MATIDSFYVKDVSRAMKSQEEGGCQEWPNIANFICTSPRLYFRVCVCVCVCVCARTQGTNWVSSHITLFSSHNSHME